MRDPLAGFRRLTPAALAAAALSLMLVAPVAAAPTPSGPTGVTLADHVTDCNVTFDAEGDLLLDGAPVIGAEATLLDALLTSDASLAAALEMAADADADACINLAIDLTGQTVTLNGDISACGDVVFTAETVTVGGVEISADLLDAELVNVLEAAAAADAEACVVVTVTDNDVVVDAIAEICAAATLLDTGVVNVVIGEDEFFFDGTLLDAEGLLEVGVTVEVNLLLTATLDIAAESIELIIEVAECAAAATPTPTPTPTPIPTPTPTPVGAATQAAPATAASGLRTLPDTTAGAVSPAAVTFFALMLLSLGGMARLNARERRRR